MRKNYKDFVNFLLDMFADKSIKILNLHYHELMGKIKKYEGKKILDGSLLYAR